ncbi:MAG TPA: hypothetical protein PLT85_10095, partial [Thauera aminoaromatica]|nr:hypothetical protein [Thauera aminoaromatica]
LDAAPPPLPTPAPAPAEPAPAACPPASSPPPGPIARRIDGVLRRPDGEILLWVEGTWQSARALGLHPIAGDAAVVVAAGRRTQLRSGELVPTAVATVTAGPGQAYPERDDAAPADRAAGPADSAARPSVDMRGARP